MIVAAFDFDGTITKNDSFIRFIIKTKGVLRFIIGFTLLAPVILLYLLKIIPNWKAKSMVFSYFFRKESLDSFNGYCEEFAYSIEGNTKEPAMNRIDYHRSKGHEIVILSASIENWIRPWAVKNQIDKVIGTKIELDDKQYLTGKFLTKNCYGQEKVNRLLEVFPERDSYTLYAYGDSRGDRELIEFADFGFLNKFENENQE